MNTTAKLKTAILASVCAAAIATAAHAEEFNIAGGDLKAALTTYARQTGVSVIVSGDAVKGVRTKGVQGNLSADDALTRILSGTGFTIRRDPSGAMAIVRGSSAASEIVDQGQFQIAQATPSRAAVETVTVTSSKLGGADVQSIPIAITALSQEQLTATQTAGGPDLVKQVPNLTFTKTNFTGYSIQIRGIGTQAISVTTDPAVAVALNDLPFLRNHFFEQEFYDLAQVEVLRGPQGTLYGRNATAGVVNLTTARPTDQFEAMASAEIGNYHQRRFEGMINLPIVDDRLDIRLAGEWTKRQGYSFNEITNERIDGRDLWSGRLSIGLKPVEGLQLNLMWEHFSENDDRIRSSKQLCKTDPGPSEIDGIPTGLDVSQGAGALGAAGYLSQGCLPTSMYSPDAFQVPNGNSLPYVLALKNVGPRMEGSVNPYYSTTQSPNLRVIESTIDPAYKVTNDIVELNADYAVSPQLSFASQTGFNHDFLYSTQDYNRFNTAPNVFLSHGGDDTVVTPNGFVYPNGDMAGDFCDPQLGCTSRLVAQDLAIEHAWQLNQEFRLSSSFSGPLNLSVGGNYLHYETEESYYVFINSLTLYAANQPYVPGVSDNSDCMTSGLVYPVPDATHDAYAPCSYIDPNPISSLNGNGHNYFRSSNPYTLNSYAAFGEVYYNILNDLKLTGGLRWTEDRKHFTEIPSEVLVDHWGYPSTGVLNQQWDQLTGRVAVNWTPKLNFTDQTLVYGTYAHGYKAGGANPPGAVLLNYADSEPNPIHPLTFKPEFIDAFELGTKNTLLDGSLTLNGNAFYYNYENYQISEIVDRTSINLNFDAHVKGAELEATWEPVPGLRFNFGGGYEATSIAKGEKAVDLMDRSAGNPDWIVVKPFITKASNCIIPSYVLAYQLVYNSYAIGGDCSNAYVNHFDPVTGAPYGTSTTNLHGDPIIPGTYDGFDPLTAPNNGEGIDKDLGGNELPNAPHFTVSAGAQYSIPLSSDWAGTLRGDFYWQDNSWARVFNDDPYDRIHGYTNLNLTLILTNQAGWQVMLYDKNVFNTTAITGTFLNSDDTGLTTNVFLTDPKLIGIRVTKNW
ncbi:MAG TPA: TonB-dependent receptor [Rhizomicrobium sp.]|nr:TonB-dependent receptor [Rhizomicrobium sp.]